MCSIRSLLRPLFGPKTIIPQLTLPDDTTTDQLDGVELPPDVDCDVSDDGHDGGNSMQSATDLFVGGGG